VAEIEDEELELLIAADIRRHDDIGVAAGQGLARLRLDRPERVGLGNGACGLDRFGDDSIDQRVAK
jgi:hypothetical protein